MTDTVLFAGGKGSRTRPMISAPCPKHTVTIGNRPLIWHVVQTILRGGTDRLIVSLNGDRPELTILTITPYGFDVPICYTHSNNQVGLGPVHDLLHVKPFVTKDEPFVVVFADAFFNVPLKLAQAPAPHIWTMELAKDADASQYGQVIAEGDHVKRIAEKPKQEQSRLIQTGAMKLPYEAFALAAEICRTAKDEAHLGHLTSALAERGEMTHTQIPEGSFIDCGRPDDIRRANAIAWEQI